MAQERKGSWVMYVLCLSFGTGPRILDKLGLGIDLGRGVLFASWLVRKQVHCRDKRGLSPLSVDCQWDSFLSLCAPPQLSQTIHGDNEDKARPQSAFTFLSHSKGKLLWLLSRVLQRPLTGW